MCTLRGAIQLNKPVSFVAHHDDRTVVDLPPWCRSNAEAPSSRNPADGAIDEGLGPTTRAGLADHSRARASLTRDVGSGSGAGFPATGADPPEGVDRAGFRFARLTAQCECRW